MRHACVEELRARVEATPDKSAEERSRSSPVETMIVIQDANFHSGETFQLIAHRGAIVFQRQSGWQV
jgi:hypothetical protein